MTAPLTATLFFATIVLSVVVHEAAHMFAARASGMRVSQFFVGFGPTLWSRRVGETEVGVKALPLGGFVRILGMAEGDTPLPSAAASAATDGRVAPAALERSLRSRGVGAAAAEMVEEAGGGDLAEVSGRLEGVVRTRYGQGPYRVGSVPWRILYGDAGRCYRERPAYAKAFAILAGPLSHAFVALLLLFGLQYLWEQPTGVSTTTVEAVLPGSPAERAGLAPGDALLEVDGLRSSSFADLRGMLRAAPGRPVAVVLERAGSPVTLTVTPEETFDTDGERFGAVGILMVPELEQRTLTEAASAAWSGPQSDYFPGGLLPLVETSVKGLGSILSPQGLLSLGAQAAGVEERDPEGVVSLVGVTTIAGQVSALDDSGRILVGLLAAINVFLMLFNLIPLPPFDGGHLAVTAVEAAGGRVRRMRGDLRPFRLPERVVSAAAVPVYAVLAFLLVASLWLDISSPLRLL